MLSSQMSAGGHAATRHGWLGSRRWRLGFALASTTAVLTACAGSGSTTSDMASPAETPSTAQDGMIVLDDTSVHWMVQNPDHPTAASPGEELVAINSSTALLEDSTNEIVRAFDLLNGKYLPWSVPAELGSAAGIDSDFIWSIDVTSDQQGLQGGETTTQTQRVDGTSGEVRWDVPGSGGLVGEEIVIQGGGVDSQMSGLSPTDGSILWTREVGRHYVQDGDASEICDKNLPFQKGTVFPNFVQPIEPTTGTAGPDLRTGKHSGGTSDTFVCQTSTGYVVPTNDGHAIFDRTGNLIGEVEGDLSTEGTGVAYVGTDYLLVAERDTQESYETLLSRTDLSGNETAWTLPAEARLLSVNGGTLLVVREGQLISIDAETGEQTGFLDLTQQLNSESSPSYTAWPLQRGFLISTQGMWLGIFDKNVPTPPETSDE